MKKICPICYQIFESKGVHHIYCSVHCRKIHHKKVYNVKVQNICFTAKLRLQKKHSQIPLQVIA